MAKFQFIPGKFYVCDIIAAMDGLNPAIAGPFYSVQLAENERIQTNIADDCYVCELVLTENGKFKFTPREE